MIYWLPLLALILFIVDYRITAGNMNVQWNGFGCVRDVVYRKAMLPMQNRLFVPYLTYILGGGVVRRGAYLLVKYLGILFMLVGFHYFLSLIGVDAALGTVLLAALMPLMMLYDYADSYWEMGFFSVIFGMLIGGESLWIMIPLLILSTLNRETSVIIVIVGVLRNGIILGLLLSIAFILTMFVITYLARNKKRYCPFNLIPVNLREWKKEGISLLSGYQHSLILIVIFIGLSVANWGVIPELIPIIITMAVFTALMIIPSMWRETRVFAPLLLVIIPLMIK
jgi:hypothetical protein